jgi:hypothetical protein
MNEFTPQAKKGLSKRQGFGGFAPEGSRVRRRRERGEKLEVHKKSAGYVRAR